MNPSQDKAPTSEVGESSFASEVLRSAQPVVVAFLAPWSRPCHILESALDEAAAACVGRLKVAKVNADNHPDLSLCYGIESIPTLLYFVDGRLRAKVVGTASKEAILAKLQTVLTGGEAASSPTPEATKENELRNE